jgi:hypothetical protein
MNDWIQRIPDDTPRDEYLLRAYRERTVEVLGKLQEITPINDNPSKEQLVAKFDEILLTIRPLSSGNQRDIVERAFQLKLADLNLKDNDGPENEIFWELNNRITGLMRSHPEVVFMTTIIIEIEDFQGVYRSGKPNMSGWAWPYDDASNRAWEEEIERQRKYITGLEGNTEEGVPNVIFFLLKEIRLNRNNRPTIGIEIRPEGYVPGAEWTEENIKLWETRADLVEEIIKRIFNVP